MALAGRAPCDAVIRRATHLPRARIGFVPDNRDPMHSLHESNARGDTRAAALGGWGIGRHRGGERRR